MVRIPPMEISVTQAKAQLTDLVRRAEAGEEVVLTRHGQEVARIKGSSARPARDPEAMRRLLSEVRASAAGKITPGPGAARSADFLYDEDGLPA